MKDNGLNRSFDMGLGMGEGTPMDIPLGMGEEAPARVNPLSNPLSVTAEPHVNRPLTSTSTFNEKQRMDSINEQVNKKVMEINNIRVAYENTEKLSVIRAMDFVEKLVSVAGGEPRISFVEVSRNFIKVATRMPMKANLHPMLPESDSNPRFHKTVTQVLISMAFIESVRWIPSETGSIIVIELV